MFGVLTRHEYMLDPWRELGSDGEFNFWHHSTWGGGGYDVFPLHPGDLFYIMKRGGIRPVVGTVRLVRYEILDLAEAWRRYGTNSGLKTFDEFKMAIAAEMQESCDGLYAAGMKPQTRRLINDDFQRRVRETDMSDHADHEIGCIVVGSPKFLDKDNWRDLSNDIRLREPDLGGWAYPGRDVEDLHRIQAATEYRPAWKRNDPDIEKDAVRFWQELGLPDDEAKLRERASRLTCAAYIDDQLIGVSTARIDVPPGLKHAFAFMGTAVAVEHRFMDISRQLEQNAIRILKAWSKDNPEKGVAGMATILQAQHMKEWPIKPNSVTGDNLHNINTKGDMVFLRWFDHITV